jgi:hypothetical protein
VCQRCIEEQHAGHSISTARTALFRTFDRVQAGCDALVHKTTRIEQALEALARLEEDIGTECHRHALAVSLSRLESCV